MAPSIQWLLGSKRQEEVTPQTRRGLPASWYRTPEMYELERRAIFSKSWMLVTHKNRFTKSGDYFRFTEAGFSFFLCKDREGNINGFHNICRHRGFPLVHADEGNVKILSCKYHGWSYGINGKLAKAPHFDELSDFDKSKNSLLPVHTHIDHLGFVWVNLEASSVPSKSWEELFGGVDTRSVYSEFNLDEYNFDHTWNMQGDYNWKALGDNYNECLHCKTSHPDTKGLVDLHAYRVEDSKAALLHYNKRQETGLNDGSGIHIASTYYYPNACMTVAPSFMYLMRCVPTSVRTCSMEYEVYRHKDAADEDFERLDGFFKRILTEDKWLCNNTQQSLEAGVYVNGDLHSRHESGPLYLQKLVKEAVVAHRAEEIKLDRKVWPAMQNVNGLHKTEEDDAFCSGLACGDGAKEVLAW